MPYKNNRLRRWYRTVHCDSSLIQWPLASSLGHLSVSLVMINFSVICWGTDLDSNGENIAVDEPIIPTKWRSTIIKHNAKRTNKCFFKFLVLNGVSGSQRKSSFSRFSQFINRNQCSFKVHWNRYKTRHLQNIFR